MSGTRKANLLGKITVLLVICCFCLPAHAKYGGGTGETNDPYLIYTAEQMNEIGLSGNSDDWDKHFLLCADIDLSAYTGTSFNIIGYYVSYNDNKPFTGVFDGNSRKIFNFSYSSTGTNCIGVFGCVSGENAEIKNLGLINPNVDTGSEGWAVGSLVGWLWDGTITNCYADGGSVAGYGDVGGLVGYNWGTITKCYSTGSVSGNLRVGGLVGYNRWSGTITNCYSMASVLGDKSVGGLVGQNRNWSTITDCYSIGSVSGDQRVGGLVGLNYSTISNCYATSSVIGNRYVGGLVGNNFYGEVTSSFWDVNTSGLTTSDGGTGKTTAEMQMMSTFTDAGWDFENVWWILEGAGYPRLCWEAKYGAGSGSPNDPYLIYTAEQMNTIGACQRDWDKHFKLMADIDLSSYTGTAFNIIGYRVSSSDNKPFTGVFDGSGHTISNFTYTSTDTDYIGLFGYVDDSNAVIKDLGLITPNFDAGTGRRVGSLLGRLQNGTITGCYIDGGSVAGDRDIGGLVGFNRDGTITDSYSSCSVSGVNVVGGLTGHNGGTIINCYSTGSVSGTRWYVGGLVGGNSFRITNSYSTGTVLGDDFVGGLLGDNAGTITYCYSSGSVSGVDYVGGLLGRNSGEVIGSFWDIKTSGQATSDGGIGKTTAEMQTMSTFTDAGWDFVGETVNGIEDIWFIGQQDYPRLWWEGMQVPMKLTPRTLNCRSEGNWVKAHLTLPQGFTIADVDPERPAILHSFGFESAPLYVFVNKEKLVKIEAAFERQALCSLAGDWPQAVTVAGFLADGNIFLGTSKVRIIHPGMKVIEELAWYWLNEDCVQPDFCDQIDMNRDSLVNLLDYALLMNINVEFVTDE